jgi:splicing factor 3A subunit 2
VVKQRDPETGARSLLFQLHYPQISSVVQPRHRLVSTFEQSVEARNDKVQYLLFAAEPYETVAFAIPNQPIERSTDKFFTHWDEATNMFYLQLFFVPDKSKQPVNAAAAASAAAGADEDEGEAAYEITDETE